MLNCFPHQHLLFGLYWFRLTDEKKIEEKKPKKFVYVSRDTQQAKQPIWLDDDEKGISVIRVRAFINFNECITFRIHSTSLVRHNDCLCSLDSDSNFQAVLEAGCLRNTRCEWQSLVLVALRWSIGSRWVGWLSHSMRHNRLQRRIIFQPSRPRLFQQISTRKGENTTTTTTKTTNQKDFEF